MNPSYFVIFFFLVLIFFQRQKKYIVLAHIRHRKKNREGRLAMETLAKQFIGKEVIIYTVSDSLTNIQGVVREVENGGMILEVKGELQAVNLEYVIRIREYPKNGKGKKKSVVVD